MLNPYPTLCFLKQNAVEIHKLGELYVVRGSFLELASEMAFIPSLWEWDPVKWCQCYIVYLLKLICFSEMDSFDAFEA